MSLLINQGKQDTTQDNKFEPITEKNVLAQITELKLAKTQTNALEITMRLLNGAHKGRFVFDRINYDPTSDFSWKYRAIRKAAGVPYSDTENVQIDIEALLLNKAITVDLGVRKGKNSTGEEQEYQNITYKVIKQSTPAQPTATPAVQPTQTASVSESVPVEKPTPDNTALADLIEDTIDDTIWD